MLNKRLVFIIGPARSGTHLVASTISNALPSAKYLAEINEFWSQYTIQNQDKVNFENYNEEMLETIRNDFLKLSEEADTVIEKTAANSLRIQFLKLLFPDAKYIFIKRNCFQVIASVLKKQKGNINKVTNSGNVTFSSRLELLIERVRSKISKVEKSPSKIWRLICDNFANILNILNLKNDTHWGPKFCSKSSRAKVKHPELYAFLQWAACTSEIENVNNEDRNNLFLDFEEIIENPTEFSQKINRFLGCADVSFNIDSRANLIVNKDDFEFYDLIQSLSSSQKERK
ncbi:sulfotransferase [Pseudoalteromonas shioyasakiensis]|uniref:sulfotransferase n=1 Tax=Pseudoalteromonas shioyasakiensis TaxID=1190813 RepID=UPI0021196038|nr:sulfotransferase [Pseudoalteromonas shioyasakiensis]MCQ8881300.1 sulfotransferase [Pseudoalteromonas shioyasakiensis]